MLVFRRARRELLDAGCGERCQVLGGAGERRERDAAGLVGQRDLDVGAAGERVQERPLGTGQVFEPVGEDRLAVPRVELRLEAFGGPTA